MKRKVILLAFVAAMVLGIVGGGVAYAVNGHQPMTGNKLVGIGTIGYAEDQPEGNLVFGIHVRLTNTDCKNDIVIRRVALLDSQGSVIVEGAPVEPIPEYLGPHQCLWLPMEPVQLEELGVEVGWPDIYSFEMEWEADPRACPPMGVVYQYIWVEDGNGTEHTLVTESAVQMVNVKQMR